MACESAPIYQQIWFADREEAENWFPNLQNPYQVKAEEYGLRRQDRRFEKRPERS